jgi:hypothetical protein
VLAKKPPCSLLPRNRSIVAIRRIASPSRATILL